MSQDFTGQDRARHRRHQRNRQGHRRTPRRRRRDGRSRPAATRRTWPRTRIDHAHPRRPHRRDLPRAARGAAAEAGQAASSTHWSTPPASSARAASRPRRSTSFDHMMDINVRSVFDLTQRCTELLKAAKGSIVNVSSVTGTRAFPGVLSYCVSKAADRPDDPLHRSRTRRTRRALQRGEPRAWCARTCTATGGCPRKTTRRSSSAARPTHPLGRIGEPEEVAEMIALPRRRPVEVDHRRVHRRRWRPGADLRALTQSGHPGRSSYRPPSIRRFIRAAIAAGSSTARALRDHRLVVEQVGDVLDPRVRWIRSMQLLQRLAPRHGRR